jgi:phosphocarrier protein HPr
VTGDRPAGIAVEIVNERGLHARAAAKFTALAETFAAEITVSNGRDSVGGRSIMGLLMLAAARGTKITISAEGTDAAAALEAVRALVEDGFGEDRD